MIPPRSLICRFALLFLLGVFATGCASTSGPTAESTLSSNQAQAHLEKGRMLSAKGDPDGAIAAYREAIRLDPDYVKAHNNLGTALYAKGDLDGALAEFRAVLRLDPNHVYAHMNLGIVLQQKGDLEGALEEYRTAVRLDPADYKTHQNLAVGLRKNGDIEAADREAMEAARLLTESLKKQPKYRKNNETELSWLNPGRRKLFKITHPRLPTFYLKLNL